MTLFANRNEIKIRQWVIRHEATLPKLGYFTIGRSEDILSEGSFLSGNKKSLSARVRETISTIHFPTQAEIDAAERAEREKIRKQSEARMARMKDAPKWATGSGTKKKKQVAPKAVVQVIEQILSEAKEALKEDEKGK